MKKSSVFLSIVLGLVLLQGCKKKEKEADKAPDTTMTGTASGTAATPPPPDPNAGTGAGTGGSMAGTGAGTGDTMAGTGAGTGAPTAMAELKPLPEGMTDDCKKAYEKMGKYRACEKHPADARADMVKAWNAAVDGTFVHYKDAKGDTKATIERTCKSMSETMDMLIKDC